MTLQDLFNSFFHPYGYKDFITKYRSLLLEPMPDRNEQEFVEAVDRDSYLLEMAAKEVAQLTSQAFRIFKSIVKNSGPHKETSDFLTTQLALHEYMFKTMYHIDRNCRKLLEAQIEKGKHNDFEAHLQYLRKKYALSQDQLILVGLKWFENEKVTYNALVARENHFKVYDTDGGCFQIYNANSDTILKAPIGAGMSNGIIISQYYFVWQIFRLFQHLQLSTQILELEKTGVTNDENTDVMETDTMDSFNQAAKELFDKQLEA